MDVGSAQSITSSYGTATLSNLTDSIDGLGLPAGNGYLVQDIQGGEYPGLRQVLEHLAQRDGALIHPFFRGPRVVRIAGLVIASTPARRQVLTDHLAGVLEPLLTEDGQWNFGTGTHTVRYYDPILFETPSSGSGGASAGPKGFSFALVVRE